MKYYRVLVEIGHLGTGHSNEINLYVKAKDTYTAMKRARMIPGVKHSRVPLSTVEITKEEYDQGMKENRYLKYMQENATKGF